MPFSQEYRIAISCSESYLGKTRELIHFISTQHGLDDVQADLVEMAVAEACHNALRHGNSGRQEAYCDLELSVDEKEIKIVVISKGKAFEFESIEPFRIDQDFMGYRKGGLGIPLIKALMDEVHYERKRNNTNRLILIKYFGSKVTKRRK